MLGAAGTTPIRARAAEDLLRGQELTDDAIRAAAATVPDAVDPLDDFRGSADYKREMAGVFTRRALDASPLNYSLPILRERVRVGVKMVAAQ